MKKLLLILFCLPLLIMAQAPQGFTYQGVATDNNGFELQNQSISIQASILSSSATGTTVWQETHTTTTDTFGLFNVTIGEGTSTNSGSSATFSEIDWGVASHFMKVEIDVNGGSNYVHVGTSQMMSVPYALYAENVHNLNMDSILGAVYDSINASGIDSLAIADMIENAIGDSPFYDGSSNQNSNMTNDSLINGYRYFYTYVSDNTTKLFETDSTQSFSNQLYSVEGGNVNQSLIRSLYVDEINQDLYFTTSPNLTAGATSLMKTSLSNFNPQVVYVIPCKTEYLSDFEIHPITGDFYWSLDSYYGGVYYYDVSANEVISIVTGTSYNYVNSLCINTSGDVFYARDNNLYDAQTNNPVFSNGSGDINKVIYYAPTNSFIMCSNDRIFDDQGNILFINPSGGGDIRDLDINYTTQRILFNTGHASVSMDIDGNNLNYNGAYPAEIQLIQAIE